MRSAFTRAGERLDRYTRELHEHGLESVDREVRWLTELIEHERTGDADPAADPARTPPDATETGGASPTTSSQ
jgi:hypothetical protein